METGNSLIRACKKTGVKTDTLQHVWKNLEIGLLNIPNDDEVSNGNCLLEIRIFIIAGARSPCPSPQHLEG